MVQFYLSIFTIGNQINLKSIQIREDVCQKACSKELVSTATNVRWKSNFTSNAYEITKSLLAHKIPIHLILKEKEPTSGFRKSSKLGVFLESLSDVSQEDGLSQESDQSSLKTEDFVINVVTTWECANQSNP